MVKLNKNGEGHPLRKYIVFVAFIVLMMVLASCNKVPSPQDRFKEYTKLWNQQKFAKMYDDYLSKDAKKEISKKDFVNRYTKIYNDLEVTKLKVQYDQPKEAEKTKEDRIELPFSVKMETVAGPIEFDQTALIVKEEKKDAENWYIDWHTGFIFPDLEAKDKISFAGTQAMRGEILDRNGNPLAKNGRAFEIGLIPEKMGDNPDDSIAKLAQQLQISPERIQKALSASWVKPNLFVPIGKIAESEVELLETLYEIPGVDKKNTDARVYPYTEAAAHLIGYTGPITADELEKLADQGYESTDMIGKRGLEQVLDKQLKGQNGLKIFIKKPDGKQVVLAEKKVQDGENITLTIDATLQQQIFTSLTGEAGASAALDPITGETLALVSSPSFDPNKMAIGMTAAERQALEDNNQQPLLNRFKSTYVPGSVIKPITAAIALTAGTLTPDKTISVQGLNWQKDKSWGDYQVTRVTDPHTPVNLEKALIYSDNIYFAQAALGLGKEKLANGLKQFGFEEGLPYFYPIETSQMGNLDSDIKVADTGYGQGQLEVNILHLSAAYTPFLNSGNFIRPILTMDEKKGQIWKKEVVSAANAAKISEILLQVVENPQGTAHSGKINGLSIAGKTGTAELKLKQGESGTELGWFVGYKTTAPHLLISMMIENVQDRGGSHVPVEKVKNIFSIREQAGQ
jgi:penicillin-binding protein 3